MTKVIQILREKTGAEKYLEDLLRDVRAGKVESLIGCHYMNDGTFSSFWFGTDSSIKSLGMATLMQSRIRDYIEENAKDVSEEK